MALIAAQIFCPFGRSLRPVDVFAPGLDGRQHFPAGGVNRLEGFTAGGGNITTVDVKLLFGHSGHGSSIIESRWQILADEVLGERFGAGFIQRFTAQRRA
jgi:hypothetical protein